MADASTLVAPTEVRPRAGVHPIKVLLKPIASLRLTVWLFAMSLVLVFVGTLAQIDAGITTVVNSYFRSVYVWVPLQLFVKLGQVFLGISTDANIGGAFPFPGGLTLGIALLVNLVTAHLVRFKLTWKRSGVLITHVGILLMLVGELITTFKQVEAKMVIGAGESVNFADVSHEVELAIVAPGETMNREVTIPQSQLSEGNRIVHPELPVDVEILKYAKNSSISSVAATDPDALVATNGKTYRIDFARSEASGVDTSAGDDLPAVRVRFLDKSTGKELATGNFGIWMYSNLLRLTPEFPQFADRTLAVGNQTYTVALRPRREYKPYSLQLLEFRHDFYEGTKTPKNFSSDVRVVGGGSDFQTKISMNSPLRHEGEALFQSSFFPDDKGTVLQVVRNPGWLLPYISCLLVFAGLTIHFVMQLTQFLARRAAA